jgi:hypothetical protein
MVTINSPCGVVVSHQASASERSLAPGLVMVSRMFRRSLVLLASLSSLVTMRVSLVFCC